MMMYNKFMKLKKLRKKDYGRIALFALVLVLLKSAIQVPLNVFLEILSDILIVIGVIAGVIWLFKKNEKSEN